MLNSNKFKGNVTFPEIELKIPGIYLIEYFYHFNCKIASCLNSDVSSTIFFEYENNHTSIRHDIKEINNTNGKWINNQLNITTEMKVNLKVK
jgi:hypothetical protein